MRFLALVLSLITVIGLLGASDPAAAQEVRQVRVVVAGKASGDMPPGMVEIPSGKAVLGIPHDKAMELIQWEETDEGRKLIAGCMPQARVDVDTFYIDIHEVTNLQYKTFLEVTGRKPSEKLIQFLWNYEKAGKIVEGSFKPGEEYFPIGAITVDEALACARWMGKRLPTEAEWTRAARGDEGIDYAWGNVWDRKKCANGSSVRGRRVETMRYKADCSPFGVFGMMGNVAEFTASPYEKIPGFKPPKYKPRGARRTTELLPPFSHRQYVIKGGTAQGRKYMNSGFFRQGLDRSGVFELVGFRCAKSPTPGQDALRGALQHDLILLGEVQEIPMAWDDTASEEITVIDKERRDLVTASDSLAFIHPARLRTSRSKIERQSVDEPVLIGVFSSSKPILDPALPTGSYAVYYKASGVPKWFKELEKKRKKNKKAGKARDQKKGGDEGKSSSEEGKKAEGQEEGAQEGAEAEKKTEEEEKPDEEALAEADRAKQDIEYPFDKDVFLIRGKGENIIAWMPTHDSVEESWVPCTFAYGPPALDEEDRKKDEPAPAPTYDEAVYTYHIRGASASRGFAFTLRLQFAKGSFDPVP